jgi:hypothetical protein
MASAPKGKGLSMRSLKLSVLDVLDDLRTGGFARPATERFGGAWLAFGPVSFIVRTPWRSMILIRV